MIRAAVASVLLLALVATSRGGDPWVVYQGADGPGHGKHVVLISGDEEYRSEEALPQLGAILAKHYGFRCTVLFAINPENGEIDPNNGRNIPGLEALKTADLMIIATRFRDLPDDQMQQIDNFLKSGKGVVGLRTATHAFNVNGDKPWAHYGNSYGGPKKEWQDGFGRLVLGEKWISHHGNHRHESTLGLIDPAAKDHPIARGLKDGDVWGPSDVYGVRLPLPGDSQPIVLGQVTKRNGQYDEKDSLYGMRPEDREPVEGQKNSPMMPIAWTKTYQLPEGKSGRSFATTMGAATDLLSEGTRRMIVNGSFWAAGLEEKISADLDVSLVGTFEPSAFSFGGFRKGMQPSDYNIEALQPKAN